MSSTCCLLSLIKTLSWQFGGGIDFPKSFNWCILWDKLSRLPSRCVLFRLEGSGFKFFLRIFKYARWYTTLRRFLEEPSSLLVRPRLRLLLLKTVLTCCTGKGIRPALPHQGIDVSFFKQTGHEPSKIVNPKSPKLKPQGPKQGVSGGVHDVPMPHQLQQRIQHSRKGHTPAKLTKFSYSLLLASLELSDTRVYEL